jgi:hypothetical protein
MTGSYPAHSMTRRCSPLGHSSDPSKRVSRFIAASWRLGRYDPGLRLSEQDQRPYAGVRRWAHVLGYGGHSSQWYFVGIGWLTTGDAALAAIAPDAARQRRPAAWADPTTM